MTVGSLVGELFSRPTGIKEALVLALARRRSSAWARRPGSRFYIQNRGEGGAKPGWPKSCRPFLARANAEPELGGRRADPLWSATVTAAH